MLLRSSSSSAIAVMSDTQRLENMISGLKGDTKVVITIMLEQFNKLRQDFRSLSEEKNEEISVLQKEVATLKSTVNKLVTDADEQNSYTRRETVILSGNIIPVS